MRARQLKTVLEGRTHLLVPAASLRSKNPATYPVFFNPAARLNRDVSVAVAAVTRPRTLLDALAGTGARGVRIANESGKDVQVTLVDFNENSLSVARRNAEVNGLEDRCLVVHSEVNRYLYSRFERAEKYDAIDLDPFGTPAPYVQGALVACRDAALLSITATDAAVLCGVYPTVARRRYGVGVPRSEFVHETALRIMAGFAVRMGGVNDIGVRPVAAHSTLHYLRVYLRVSRGATAADESLSRLGYVVQCTGCFNRSTGTSPITVCPHCGKGVRPAGPLWLGPICDEELVSRAAAFCREEGWSDSAARLDSLRGIDGFPPYSYSVERCASRSGVSSVPLDALIDALRERGFKCIRQPFEEISVKTDASASELADVVRDAHR